MNFSEFGREDYWNLKWRLLFLLGSIAIITGIFFGMRYIDQEALLSLRSSRSAFDNAQQALDKIEEEEATIIEYIGRYDELKAANVVGEEDRLEFLENFARIRTDNNMFPIQYRIDTQDTTKLPYPDNVRNPGRPVLLHHSGVEVSMPLLHEDDLSRLLDSLLGRPDLVQSWNCRIAAANRRADGYIRLGQHFTSNCTFAWLSFTLDAAPGGNQ